MDSLQRAERLSRFGRTIWGSRNTRVGDYCTGWFVEPVMAVGVLWTWVLLLAITVAFWRWYFSYRGMECYSQLWSSDTLSNLWAPKERKCTGAQLGTTSLQSPGLKLQAQSESRWFKRDRIELSCLHTIECNNPENIHSDSIFVVLGCVCVE